MRLADQIRRSLKIPAARDRVGDTETRRRRNLISELQREVLKLQRRPPRPVDPPPPRSRPTNPDMPEPVDPEGMIYRQRYPAGHAFGKATVSFPDDELLAAMEGLLRMEGQWSDDEPPLRAEELLFIDLETTGLSRSAGTLPFLTGVGRFAISRADPSDAGELIVDQLLLQDPSHEPRMLELLEAYLQRSRLLISFNGRGFDIPVLKNRTVLNRTRLPLDRQRHLDLLTPCRRLFRPRLENCRLGTLEREVLGYERVGDVDGAEVPLIYNDFLLTRRTDELALVLEHNLLDVALMAPLLEVTTRHLTNPLQWAEDGDELLGAARIHLRSGDPALAEACLRRGLELARIPATRRRLLTALAHRLRRQGERKEASELWEQYRREFPDLDVGWIELAKYHEHVTKNLRQALHLVERCPAQHREELQHRLDRLRRRVQRLEESA